MGFNGYGARNGDCLFVMGQKERSRTRLLPPWRRGRLFTSRRWLGIVLRSAALYADGFQRLRQEATCLRHAISRSGAFKLLNKKGCWDYFLSNVYLRLILPSFGSTAQTT